MSYSNPMHHAADARASANQPSIQYLNGRRAHADGFPRHQNPVAYCGAAHVFSAAQARVRDDWFDGWDAADAE